VARHTPPAGGVNVIIGSDADDIRIGSNISDLIRGDAGNDTLAGGNGFDTLVGGVGNDVLDGGAGFDTLVGGVGDDVLSGGAGVDTFFYTGGAFGNDTVLDFEVHVDRIALDASLAGQALELLVRQVGSDTVITPVTGGGTITLNNVNASSLSAGDFIFI